MGAQDPVRKEGEPIGNTRVLFAEVPGDTGYPGVIGGSRQNDTGRRYGTDEMLVSL